MNVTELCLPSSKTKGDLWLIAESWPLDPHSAPVLLLHFLHEMSSSSLDGDYSCSSEGKEY